MSINTTLPASLLALAEVPLRIAAQEEVLAQPVSYAYGREGDRKWARREIVALRDYEALGVLPRARVPKLLEALRLHNSLPLPSAAGAAAGAAVKEAHADALWRLRREIPYQGESAPENTRASLRAERDDWMPSWYPPADTPEARAEAARQTAQSAEWAREREAKVAAARARLDAATQAAQQEEEAAVAAASAAATQAREEAWAAVEARWAGLGPGLRRDLAAWDLVCRAHSAGLVSPWTDKWASEYPPPATPAGRWLDAPVLPGSTGARELWPTPGDALRDPDGRGGIWAWVQTLAQTETEKWAPKWLGALHQEAWGVFSLPR